MLLAVPTGVAPGSLLAGWTYLIGLALIVLALWSAAGSAPVGSRGPWLLLAGVATCWFVGDAVQRVLEWLGRAPEGAGLPDLFWLGAYPLLIASVVGMVRALGLPAELRREIGLDVLVLSAAAGVWAWHLLLVPTWDDDATVAYSVVSALYPLGALCTAALALTLLMVPARRGVATRLLLTCLALTLPLDVLHTVLPGLAPEFDPARLDGAQLVVNGLLAIVAVHPSRHELTHGTVLVDGHSLHRWRVVLLGVSLCAVSLLATLAGGTPSDRAPYLVMMILMTVTIVIRFYLVVSDREAAQAQLEYAATHDHLTGAANRHLLVQRLGGVAWTSGGVGPTLFLLDLDGFKAVNDDFGHAAGDEVLCAVTGRLSSLFRAEDTVARLGGDEFVVLAHGISPQDAESMGVRLRAAMMVPIPLAYGEVRVGVSVGVLTTRSPVPLDAGDLLRSVDEAMYEAKRSGSGVRIRDVPDVTPHLVSRRSSRSPISVPG